MSIPPEKPSPPVLEYARPPTSVSVRRVLAGVFGIAAGLCGAPLIVLGLLGIAYAITSAQPRIDRQDDLRKAVLLTSIGVVLAVAARRWCRRLSMRRCW